MMSQIAKEIKKQEMSQVRYTENGAEMYATSGKNLLDMNFKVASYRGKSEDEIIADFTKAFNDDPDMAVKWLFFIRDIRGGLGERRLFRIIFNHLIATEKKAWRLIQFVAEFGRWDDLIELLDGPCPVVVSSLIREQIREDIINIGNNKPISLCAKWLPSINTSSKKTVKAAKDLAKMLGMTDKQYRQMLSKLRSKLDVIEVKTSANKWDEINYEAVPSMANLKYKTAFFKHDEERRKKYLAKLEKGEVKINSSVTFPHDIVHQYSGVAGGRWDRSNGQIDETLEAMWKALPNYGLEDTLVVADGSGSMTTNIPGTTATALEVANALAIYCSEHNKGEFKDCYITFSENPQYVNFSKAESLYRKIKIALGHCEIANTNIAKVFKLILDTAKNNGITQDEMVKNILIISDMEFDSAVDGKNLFESIAQKYEDVGLKLPRIIFLNVNSRTNAIPMQENENGVALISGFSVNICKMILSGKLDAYECLREQLESDRYKEIYLEG